MVDAQKGPCPNGSIHVRAETTDNKMYIQHQLLNNHACTGCFHAVTHRHDESSATQIKAEYSQLPQRTKSANAVRQLSHKAMAAQIHAQHTPQRLVTMNAWPWPQVGGVVATRVGGVGPQRQKVPSIHRDRCLERQQGMTCNAGVVMSTAVHQCNGSVPMAW